MTEVSRPDVAPAPEAQAPAADAAREPTVGEMLVQARTALGLSLEDCAQQLKFSVRKIEALEQGRYEELPGGTFARGMLRSYARLLNLDAQGLVDRVADQVQVPDTTTTAVSLRRPIPFSEPGKRGNLLYVGLSLLALVIVAWVAWGWQQERSRATKLTFVPAAQEAAPRADGVTVATVTPTIVPVQQAPEAEAKAEAQAAAKPDSGPAAKPAATPAVARDDAPRSAKGSRRLALRFERESWVEVRGSNGKQLLVAEVHPAGSERVIEGEPPFAIVIGNAKYVRLAYDGKPVDLAPFVKVDVARMTLE